MRVLMTGGGTGGHVNPALAIADTIRAHEPESVIAFVGTSRGIENKLVPAAGYELYRIEIEGLRRSLSLRNFRTLGLMVTSQHKAKALLHEFRPDLVVGTGGYVCWPMVHAAAKAGIPTALHESNAIPGVAVKMLEGEVDRIFVNFETTRERLHHPEKVMRVGNPLRRDFSTLSQSEARESLGYTGKYRKLLLSYGGSLGAERINAEVLQLMKNYSAKHPDLRHIHGTGAGGYEETLKQFQAMGLQQFSNLELTPYIDDMPRKMAAADLVITRAGAMTLSEIAMLHKPSILIPSPNVTDNHQFKNAKALADVGAALLLEESDLKDGVLIRAVSSLLSDREKLAEMGNAVGTFALPECCELLYQELCKLVETRRHHGG